MSQIKIVPFPQIRRRRFILKTAQRLAGAPSKTAEKLLAATLRLQAEAMVRKQIAPDLIEREYRALELAIRAELWRQVIVPDGAA
jgi:hypothetical protein